MTKYLHIALATLFFYSFTIQAQINTENNKSKNFPDEMNSSENRLPTVTGEINEAVAPVFHNVVFGVRFMPTTSSIKVQNSDGNSVDGKIVLSYGFGGLLAYNFFSHMGIQLEVLYNTLSQKYADHSLNRKIDLNYLNIPLLLSLNTGRSNAVNINVVVGPQLGVNVGSSVTTTGTGNGNANTKAVLDVKKNDFGIAYGAGLDFGLNAARTIRLDLGFRGVNSLIDVSGQNKILETDSYYILQKKRTQTYSGYIGLTFLL